MILQVITELIVKVLECDIDKVNENSMLIEDLMVDSLSIAKIAVEIEDYFDVMFDEDFFYPFEDISVGAFCEKVEAFLEGQASNE